MKPKMFVGSSSEGERICKAVQYALRNDCDVIPWRQGVFQLSSNILDDLLTQLDKVDFGLFVLSPDDVLKMRGEELAAARDNVIFELGLFIGRLGKERTFFLTPKDTSNFRLPSDLLGVTAATFDATRVRGDLQGCVADACFELQQAIERVMNRRDDSKAASARSELHQLILHCFRLYKDTLRALGDNAARVRLHLLKYDQASETLRMLIQDDDYEDRDFVSTVEDGVRQGIVVCEALRRKKLIARNLDQEHSAKYSDDSPIPYALRSVMAHPVRYKSREFAGVVALDSELKLEEFGIDERQLCATFVKLCCLIESLIADDEEEIREI